MLYNLENVDMAIHDAYAAFDERFERIFNLTGKGYSKRHVEFAQAALSNMLGGIG